MNQERDAELDHMLETLRARDEIGVRHLTVPSSRISHMRLLAAVLIGFVCGAAAMGLVHRVDNDASVASEGGDFDETATIERVIAKAN